MLADEDAVAAPGIGHDSPGFGDSTRLSITSDSCFRKPVPALTLACAAFIEYAIKLLRSV